MSDLIKADDLAAELAVDMALLFDRAILGEMPVPYWRRAELVEWVAAFRQPAKGGTEDEQG